MTCSHSFINKRQRVKTCSQEKASFSENYKTPRPKEWGFENTRDERPHSLVLCCLRRSYHVSNGNPGVTPESNPLLVPPSAFTGSNTPPSVNPADQNFRPQRAELNWPWDRVFFALFACGILCMETSSFVLRD